MKRLDAGFLLLSLMLVAMALVPIATAAVPYNATDSGVDEEIDAILSLSSAMERIPIFTDPSAEEKYLASYESPARKAIKMMKGKNYTEKRISEFLAINGYGWDPRTGACWKGELPTVAEQKTIDVIRGPDYSPFPSSHKENPMEIKNANSLRENGATMNLLNTNTYFGIYVEMKPGEMMVRSGGTFQHVLTTHVGKKKPSGVDDWTEAGVVQSVNNPEKRYFTYDNDEGQWLFHGLADAGTFTPYKIYITNTWESAGYVYHIWIDGRWVRSGHLYYRQTQYNCANEIWAFNNDPFNKGNVSYFQNAYLYKSGGRQCWGNYWATPTNIRADYPPNGSKYMSGSAYTFRTWV